MSRDQSYGQQGRTTPFGSAGSFRGSQNRGGSNRGVFSKARRPLVVHTPVGGHRGDPALINIGSDLNDPRDKIDRPISTSHANAHDISGLMPNVQIYAPEGAGALPPNHGIGNFGDAASDRANTVGMQDEATRGGSWVDVLHQLFQASQEEMRREMGSIRANMAQLNAALESTQQANQQHRNASRMDRNPLPSVVPPMYPTPSSIAVKPQEWKIAFDGTGSVADFLFKLNTLCERTQCPDEQIMASFHLFLSGRAEEWYWLFTKQNPNATYAFLCYSLKREFGTLKTDHEIMMEISMRKQKASECYDVFHADIISLNARLREPMSELLLIDIIKRNVNSSLKLMLFNADVRTLHDLRDVARRGEQVLKESKLLGANYPGRHVSEARVTTPDMKMEGEDGEIDPQIEALEYRRSRRPDYSGIQCWNCQGMGHSYIYFEEPIKSPFCFKCGYKGVFTPKCPRDHRRQGNQYPSEKAGEPRSAS
ncbi:uncharacterized protein [Eurosta solidaginis]|uniref:uncharacterized protein n=1 Tax=Eurosta solidaginis TaxID=178769 RepID=UPI0035308EA0